ncbi:hypothetical protein AgCh_008199 [Apium graveolens]
MTTHACGKPIKGGLEYPFWGDHDIRPWYCGLKEFELSCEEDDLVVDIGSDSKYRVVEVNPSSSVLILNSYNNSLEDICASTLTSSTILDETLYDYGDNTEEIHLFYQCGPAADPTGITFKFPCSSGDKKEVYLIPNNDLPKYRQSLGSCKYATLPVNMSVLDEIIHNKRQLAELLMGDIKVRYNSINKNACIDCVKTDGLCWNGTSTEEENTCLYSNGTVLPPYPTVPPPYPTVPPPYPQPGNKKNLGPKIGIATGVVVSVSLILLALFLFCRRRKAKQSSYVVSRNISSSSFSMSDSEKGSGTYMGVPTFSYNELEKATNDFHSNNELGDGGFGAVYKGKLQDGREVAVKRLYENSIKRVEQFMNEIKILTQLRHPNLVVLYGSTSQQCRKLLLVYEYIPNGTIADHLYGEDAERGNLTWKTRMSIAVETASALSYLHVSEVIHRDVKTTNILLDNNFHVKVADFGLSRLFPLNATHVSTAPQGTPGYVDPEYHQCYQLTSKSDVYSFGVVLIELISSKPAVDITRHRHEINLANLAINKIQSDKLDELVDPTLGFESDDEVRKMITEVAELAFRCLQSERELRPSMQEVHKSLKEIQSRNSGKENELQDTLFRDDASLLKNYPQNLSPNSVTAKWVSSRSTNSSSSI